MSKREKPKACRIPKEAAEIYCLTAADWDALADLALEMGSILDFYHEMPENETGILATDAPERQENLIDLLDGLRDTVQLMERIPAKKEAPTDAAAEARPQNQS